MTIIPHFLHPLFTMNYALMQHVRWVNVTAMISKCGKFWSAGLMAAFSPASYLAWDRHNVPLSFGAGMTRSHWIAQLSNKEGWQLWIEHRYSSCHPIQLLIKYHINWTNAAEPSYPYKGATAEQCCPWLHCLFCCCWSHPPWPSSQQWLNDQKEKKLEKK